MRRALVGLAHGADEAVELLGAFGAWRATENVLLDGGDAPGFEVAKQVALEDFLGKVFFHAASSGERRSRAGARRRPAPFWYVRSGRKNSHAFFRLFCGERRAGRGGARQLPGVDAQFWDLASKHGPWAVMAVGMFFFYREDRKKAEERSRELFDDMKSTVAANTAAFEKLYELVIRQNERAGLAGRLS